MCIWKTEYFKFSIVELKEMIITVKFSIIKQNGGFDYIIGNPPWGRIKANIR